jgi:hypothetical protein
VKPCKPSHSVQYYGITQYHWQIQQAGSRIPVYSGISTVYCTVPNAFLKSEQFQA